MRSMSKLRVVAFLFVAGASLQYSFGTISELPNPSFPDTPANHWAYEGMAYLKSLGFLIGLPDGIGRGVRPRTRFELAVAYHASGTNLLAFAGGLGELENQIELDPPGSDRAAADLKFFNEERMKLSNTLLPRTCNYLVRGLKEFSPEIHDLGATDDLLHVAVPQLRSVMSRIRKPHVGRALQQFPDVPAGHWAANAVLEMRKLGLLHGYPDGSFLGQTETSVTQNRVSSATVKSSLVP
jgi:hypothetical protein